MKIVLQLKQPYLLNILSDDEVLLKIDRHSFRVTVSSREIADALLKLNTGIQERDLYAVCKDSDESSCEKMKIFVSSLKEHCCLDYCIYPEEDSTSEAFIISPKGSCVMPNSADSELSHAQIVGKYQLSRFSCFRSRNGWLCLENPLSNVNIVFRKIDYMVWLISILHDVYSAHLFNGEAINKTSQFFLNILLDNCFIVPRGGTEKITHTMWSFYDFLFHKSSRMQEAPYPPSFGASFPYPELEQLLPILKNPMSAYAIKLDKPCLLTLQEKDRSFTHVLESRQSRRIQDQDPISKEQLFELLYRVFHLKVSSDQKTSFRVYPNAGGLHEYETYVLVHRCRDLEEDLYHYHPVHHGLYSLNISREYVNEMLKLSACAWGNTKCFPQVLIILSARFPRQFWKYEGIGYRNILINAGAIMQTIYLVSEAMDLAACCLGYGCSDLFSKVIQSDPFEESSILEIAIGSRITVKQG